MRRLPPYHVPRPRLSDRCADAGLVVVEAAAGFGKSVLAVELVDGWGAVGIEVALEPGAVPAPLLAARLHAAVARAGFTQAAAAARAGEDPVGAVDALLDALAGERCAIVIDDAHHAGPDAGALIAHVAERLAGEQRLIVLARALPQGAERLRRAEYLRLDSADLALRADETLAVCREGFGLELDAGAAALLEQATGGWTAATVLAAARAQRTGETLEALAAVADRPADAVGALLEEAMVALVPTAGAPLLALLGQLPLLDRGVVDAATATAGFFDRALAAGLPFIPARGPWFDLPGPVRDHLASLAPAPADALRRAAEDYGRRGELSSALQLLLACGDGSAAAALLAGATHETIEAMDLIELRSVYERLPAEAVDEHPWLLYKLAYICELAAIFDQRTEHLERARAIVSARPDAALVRALDAERAHDQARDFDYVGAERRARALLASTPADEVRTRARASAALGRALVGKIDATGRRDPTLLADAERCYATAADLYRSAGMLSAVAGGTPFLAMMIDFARGHADAALARLRAALPLLADRPMRRGLILSYCAEVATELGRPDEAEAYVAEIFRLARQLDNKQLFAYGHWDMAHSASVRGDADAALEHMRRAEQYRDTWWLPASADFLAEGADLLDRVGHTAIAREYLERAREEPKDAGHLVAVAAAAIESRHGDPALAEQLLAEAARVQMDQREAWRMTLFRAHNALRRGDHRAAGELAARAFEQAARIGQPAVPLIRERAIAESLLGLAVATGHPAALALEATALPVMLAVLGRFELTVGGRAVPLAGGQGAQLLKLVTVSGRRIGADQLIEAIWPEVAIEAGRNRLRTVLNRLRTAAGDLIVREGETLVLDPAVHVDLDEFLAEGRRARSLAGVEGPLAAAIARGAIARYRGELLPDDRYEHWADAPRERARREMLDLLDLCADEAARRGDLDEVRRIVEQAIEMAPHDDIRYVRAVTAMIDQGRRGEALAVIRRARAAFAEIGLDAPDQLDELERGIAESGAAARRHRLRAGETERHDARRPLAGSSTRRRPPPGA